jgi:hypothetical protein
LLGGLVRAEGQARERALAAALVIGAGLLLAWFTLRDARQAAAARASG